ncbi:hypothetical protein C0993_010212, partial [Termitomyces sp. T159_Od127]
WFKKPKSMPEWLYRYFGDVISVMTCHQPLGLSSGPRTPTPPKQPPRLPQAQTATQQTPLGNPWPSPPITTTSHHHLWHLPGHHCRDCHISAGLSYHTADNCHISASTSNT